MVLSYFLSTLPLFYIARLLQYSFIQKKPPCRCGQGGRCLQAGECSYRVFSISSSTRRIFLRITSASPLSFSIF